MAESNALKGHLRDVTPKKMHLEHQTLAETLIPKQIHVEIS